MCVFQPILNICLNKEVQVWTIKDSYNQPMTSLEEGVRQYVQNYLNQEDIYR